MAQQADEKGTVEPYSVEERAGSGNPATDFELRMVVVHAVESRGDTGWQVLCQQWHVSHTK